MLAVSFRSPSPVPCSRLRSMAPFDRSSPLCESVQQLAKGVPHTGPHRSPRYLNDQIFQFGIHHGVERNHRAPFPSSLFSFHLFSSSSSSFSFSSIPSPSTEACVSFRRLFGYFSSLCLLTRLDSLFSSVCKLSVPFLLSFASSPNAATLRFILFFLLLVVDVVVFERLLCLVLLCSHGRHPNVAKNIDERRGTSSSPSSSSPSSPSLSSSLSLSSSSLSSRRVGFVLSRRIRGENVCRCIHPLFTWLQRGQPRESHRVGLAREQPDRVYAPSYQRQGHVSSAESTSMVDGSILLVSRQPSLDSRSRMLNSVESLFHAEDSFRFAL